MNKFLIIGTGGVGGSIAGFLALAGKDVTCNAAFKADEYAREHNSGFLRLPHRAFSGTGRDRIL